MARQIRMEYAGAVYHVMARGNQGRAVFADDGYRMPWLETLGKACAKTGWRIHARVLMGNQLSPAGGNAGGQSGGGDEVAAGHLVQHASSPARARSGEL